MGSVEILAPAGDLASMYAAFSGGADAVYCAGNLFGARAYAKNFSTEEMFEAIEYAQIRKKKLYLTVNTLLKNEEIKEYLYDFLCPFYEAGLHGIIVQDTGVMKFVHENFPELEIHGSTQLSITQAHALEAFRQIGMTRFVPARELSLEEVRELKKQTGLEVECFVHGALCYCYSGQCLFSSFAGGRSGNRGKCAQPCRKTYTLQNGKTAYFLSPKDICTIELLPELIEAGVDSFKIEGRMKSPEYSALTAYLYKKYATLYEKAGKENYYQRIFDKNHRPTEEYARDFGALSDLFNRGGFSKGYYVMHHGPEMMSTGRQNHYGTGIGEVILKKDASSIQLKLAADIRKDDVLEIRNQDDVSLLTINGSKDGKKGETVSYVPFENRTRILKELQQESKKGKLYLYRLRNYGLMAKIGEDFLRESCIHGKSPLAREHSFLSGVPISVMLSAHVGQPLSLQIRFDFQTALDGEVLSDIEFSYGRKRSSDRKFLSDGKVSPEKDVTELSSNSGIAICVSSDTIVEKAQKAPMVRDKIETQLKKTGSLPWKVESVILNLDENCFFSMSVLNELRREGLERLKQKLLSGCRRSGKEKQQKNQGQVMSQQEDGIKAMSYCFRVATPEQLSAVINYISASERLYNNDLEIILNGSIASISTLKQMLEMLRNHFGEKRKNLSVFLTMPSIFRNPAQQLWKTKMSHVLSGEWLDGCYIRNYESYGFLKELGFAKEIRGDQTLYCYNDYAEAFLKSLSIERRISSPELTLRELQDTNPASQILTVYGSQNVMVSAQCLQGNELQCKRKDHPVNGDGHTGFDSKSVVKPDADVGDVSVLSFWDEKKEGYFGIPVCDYCYFNIYHQEPTNLCESIGKIRESGFYGILYDFISEDETMTGHILDAFFPENREYKETSDGRMPMNSAHNRFTGRFFKGID